MNGVHETATGDLLRAGFCDFLNDGSFDAATETYRTDVPEPAKVRYHTGLATMHRWNGSAWVEITQPTPPVIPGYRELIGIADPAAPAADRIRLYTKAGGGVWCRENNGNIVDVVGEWVEDEFTATVGQTVFALSAQVDTKGDVSVIVNTLGYARGTHFTVSGSTMTWLNTPFAMDTGDTVVVKYRKGT